MSEIQTTVSVTETAGSPYAQTVSVGRHILSADEPVRNGEADLGPSPYETLLAELAASTGMTLRKYADRHGWSLRQTTVELHHWKCSSAGEAPRHYFHRVIQLDGELTELQKLKLLRIAEKHPVSHSLTRSAALSAPLASDLGLARAKESSFRQKGTLQ